MVDPHDDEDSFERIVRQAEREFLAAGRLGQPKAPFYHYTNARGLQAILETEVIWTTEYSKLNDPGELTRGEHAVQDELDATTHESSANVLRGLLCRQMQEVRRCQDRLLEMPNKGIYMASFSSHGDLLSQWRAYADDAQGYAIGFKSLPLPPIVPPSPDLPSEWLGVDFGPCSYSEEEYRARVRATLFFIADGLEKYVGTYCKSAEQRRQMCNEAVASALARLAALVPFLKDPAFIDEKEWRIVVVGPMPAKLTRKTRYGETPYVEMPLRNDKRMDLYEIIRGPREASAKEPDFLRSTAERCGYGGVKITASRVPYR